MVDRSDLRLLEDSAARFCEQVGGGQAHRQAAGLEGFVPERWTRMVEAGWISAAVPAECDGAGLGARGLCVLMRQAGRALITEPVAPAAAAMAAASLLPAGSPAGAFPDGAVIALALQDGPHGIDHRRSAIVARLARGGMVLRGSRRFVPFGALADRLVLTAMLDGELVACVIDAAAPGVDRSGRVLVDATASAEIGLVDVAVPADRLLARGREAETFTLALSAFLHVAVAAELLGVARRAFDIGIEHLKSRRQFGRTLGSFQALQHQAAWNHVELSMSEALVAEAARALDEERDWRPALAAKAHAAETALSATKSVIQYLGATGFTHAHDAHLYLKRALVLASSYGTAPFLRGAFRSLHGHTSPSGGTVP